MLLKRKRSANILSSPTSDSTSTNSVQAFYQPTKPILSPFQDDWKPPFCDADTPSHLNTRTRKRHRDNRPDASTVHGPSNSSPSSSSSSSSNGASCWLGAVIQMSALADVCRVAASTIQRLYDAQRASASMTVNGHANLLHPAHPQQVQSQSQPLSEPHAVQQTVPQKSTLHSFWNIAQPAPTQAQLLQQQQPQPMNAMQTAEFARCEDCDGDLRADEDAMDVDIGEGSVEDKACASCRRRVCDACAVIAHERVCESCARGAHGW